ncbi:MAG: HaeII family restriction endonuclease [Planctomycetaceae bacterium]|jgi:type II restriction enzyme|nr:HaeII family restriction endonuclease [Planctomycetaceae bacterium]
MEVKERLNTLIKKSRADLYKPIAIAEILFHNRTEQLDVADLELYRRKSYEWMRDIIWQLHRKTTQLNSRYWDQLFNESVLPPSQLVKLAKINRQLNGIVEVYIYAHVREKFAAFSQLRQTLESLPPEQFSLNTFLGFFEQNVKYRGSIDKAYEIVVYALFNAIVDALQARITLAVVSESSHIIRDFEDFSKLVLGIDSQRLSIEKPARLFRVGTANVNDAGLDMWANFGPAVQVKHISLQPSQTVDICNGVRADQVIVVCKTSDAEAIEAVIAQMGLDEKLRGIITKDDLKRWYEKCFQEKYRQTLGQRIINSIVEEMKLEFPLSLSEAFDDFFEKRNYNCDILQGDWMIF